MELRYDLKLTWPSLTWVAECQSNAASSSLPPAITVKHGARVETRSQWFGECIWDGPFEDGKLDETEALFGSGGRSRGDALVFVSSASMIDRLQYIQLEDRLLVSNSLVALLAASGAELAPLYARYYRDFDTVNSGYRRYKPTVETSRGPVRLVYHRNLIWDGSSVREEDKPGGDGDFDSYGDYRSFLAATVAGLASNARSSSRRFQLGLSSTLSNGFDSTATAALLAPHGLDEALAVEETDSKSAENIGRIAAALGVDLRMTSRYDALSDPMRAVSFLASGGLGYEMQFGAFDGMLHGRAVFTGYYGDIVWERAASIPARPDLSRLAQSGLSLTEFRLAAGFIHCPLPFLGARQATSIKSISEQAEMKPWILGQTGYDRPIARRIAEEAGVPRDAFGYRKMVGSLAARTRMGRRSPASEDFLAWLEEVCGSSLLSPVTVSRLVSQPRRLVGELSRHLLSGWSKVPVENKSVDRLLGALRVYGREDYLFKFTFPWAVRRHMERSGLAARPASDRQIVNDDVVVPSSVGLGARGAIGVRAVQR